ncbi:MAG: YeeE/YedE family protein [Proteobacteria bacterium]|nr:YeeE/YedE family protein [Pseudomonadota bacterium]
MNIVLSFAVGLIFGLGLIISGMSDPAKVLGFLDLAGHWDPSLSFVMAGAIALGAIAFKLASRRNASLLGRPMQIPTARQIDRRLVVGSTLFGIGWGLAGICPGPAFVLLGTGATKGIVFVLALLTGMGLFEFRRRLQHSNA